MMSGRGVKGALFDSILDSNDATSSSIDSMMQRRLPPKKKPKLKKKPTVTTRKKTIDFHDSDDSKQVVNAVKAQGTTAAEQRLIDEINSIEENHNTDSLLCIETTGPKLVRSTSGGSSGLASSYDRNHDLASSKRRDSHSLNFVHPDIVRVLQQTISTPSHGRAQQPPPLKYSAIKRISTSPLEGLENSSPDVDFCSPPFPTTSKFKDAVGGTPRNDLSHSHSVFKIISQSAKRISVNRRAIQAPESPGPRKLRYCSELIISVPSIGQGSFRSLTTSGFNLTRAALQSRNSDISVPVESRYELRSKSRSNDSKGNISDLEMSSASTSGSNDVQLSVVQSILNNFSKAYYNNSGDLFASSVHSHSNSRSVQPDYVMSVLEDTGTAPHCDDQPSLNLNYQEMVLDFCTPSDIVDFDRVFNKYKRSSWSKLGEGAYGEVFRGRAQRGIGNSVYKIMPIAGDCNVNDEPQKGFDEIIPELVVTSELSNLRMAIDHSCPNFVKLKSMICARGFYPPNLLNAWDIFAAKKRSENDRPDFLSNDQLYIIFELDDGGVDLENFKFSSIDQAISIFRQITMALAVAETQLEFEHRDLHIGNVLVKPTKKKYLTYKLAGTDAQVLTCGLQAHIIDFTLSRCQRSTEQGITQLVFSNLEADEALFGGSGDYQFDVYRLMRELVENDWSGFHPKTNIFWLHYLCDKIINHFKYSDKMLNDNEFRTVVYEQIMSFESALAFVTESDFFADVYL